jgi:4-hydroxybenzoate polyprenyltransferase
MLINRINLFGFMQSALFTEGGRVCVDEAARSREMLTCDLTLPLVVDLDHTLIATDTLHESLIVFLKRRGRQAWRIPYWLLAGRSTFKNRVAGALTEEDVKSLPVNDEVIAFAEREASRGRRIVLATAADLTIAQNMQRRFPFISEVIASTDGANLKGLAKAEEVMRQYPDGFIYAGDSRADLHVWEKASGAIFVGRSAKMVEEISKVADVQAVFLTKALNISSLRKGLRVHQWAKNSLVFVPLILGGRAEEPIAWLHGLAAFTALSLLASATYLLNDLWDLAEDRRHWSKRNRPLASGELSIATGVALMVAAGMLSFLLGFMIGLACVATLTLYLVISLAYSFRLKREPVVDLFMLATLFTMRLALGMVVVEVRFSPWLLVFSMFVFLSLSTAKRQTEITRMVTHGHNETPGRGYRATDAPLFLALGVGTMMASVLIMVIYLVEDALPAGYYNHPQFLWGFPIVIFLWLSRIWLLCHRDELHDDPVAFALKDYPSLLYAGMMLILFVAAVF